MEKSHDKPFLVVQVPAKLVKIIYHLNVSLMSSSYHYNSKSTAFASYYFQVFKTKNFD